MGEARYNPEPPKRLRPLVHEGRVIGHGQQLAAERLSDRLQHLSQVHGTTRPSGQPAPIAERTLRRRMKRAEARQAAKVDVAEALAAMRERRKKNPSYRAPDNSGQMLSYAAVFTKRRGAAARSTRTLSQMPNGSPIPVGLEVTFHATKGLRVVRVGAA